MKNTTLKRIFCIFMAVMLLLPAFSVLALAVDTDNGEIKKITSQPTAQKPTVETNDAEASYQWYYAETGKITDQNASPIADLPLPMMMQGESGYTNGVGWTPAVISVADEMSMGLYFQVQMKEGEELIVNIDKVPLFKHAILIETEGFEALDTEIDRIDDSTIRISGIEEDCEVILAVVSVSTTSIINAEIPSRDAILDAVEGQTTNTLTKYELGKSYACEVTFSDGSEEISSVISYVPMITKQPTIADPSVSVSLEEYATYKWFETAYNQKEINLDNAQTFDAEEVLGEEGGSSYDSENGWTPYVISDSDFDISYYFMITLNEGDAVKLNSMPEAEAVMLVDFVKGETLTVNVNNEIKVATSGEYALVALNGNGESLKAQVFEATLGEAIEGQTTNTLTEYEVGKTYACVVTWTQGETVLDQQSNKVEMKYVILEQPTPQKPTIEVSFKDNVAKYEWFTSEVGEYSVTDKNSTPYGEATYDSENGWSGVYGGFGISYFIIKLNAGDTLSITGNNENFGEEDVVLNGKLSGINLGATLGENGEIIIEITEDDEYTFITNPEYADLKIHATVYGAHIGDEAVEGQNTSTLTDFEVGEVYFARVTYKDGTELISNALLMEYEITSQPTAQKPTVETNKNEDVKKYSWYKQLISDFYEMKTGSGIVDGRLMVDTIYEGNYADGKWTASGGYINIAIQTEVGDTVKVTLNEDFEGEIKYYSYDIYFEEQDDGSFTYTIGEEDDTYLDFEISDYNYEAIEATIELIRNGKAYFVADKVLFDEENGKYYPNYVGNGYYDGEKWISGYGEIYIELELEDGYVIEIKPSEEFNGEFYASPLYGSVKFIFTENNGVYSFTTADGWGEYEMSFYDDSDFTAEITVKKADKTYEVAEKSPFVDEEMIYDGFYVSNGEYIDGAYHPMEDTGEIGVELSLYKNSVITIKPSEDFDGRVVLHELDGDVSVLYNENGVYTYVAREAGYYDIQLNSENGDFSFVLYVQKVTSELIENQTTKTLSPSEMGSYYVDVEFKDGTVLTSNIFEINSVVMFNTNGGTSLESVSTIKLTEIGKTEREGFVLEGWYLDKELTEKAELPLDISGIVNLYAKWSKCDHKNSSNKPTCTEDAECTVCKADYKATGHNYNSSYTASEDKHYLECSVCGAKQSEGDHSFGEWNVTKYAERKTQGEEKRACTVCGHTESRAIEALGGLSNGAIVGIIIGSGALLASIAVATFILIKRKRVK